MKLSAGEMRFLSDVRLAGADGLAWSARHSSIAHRLLRKGLIDLRVGPAVETENGRRTRLRFVATKWQGDVQ
jgi:hypothetical protein